MHKIIYYLLVITLAAGCRVMPKPYSLNEDVKQEVEDQKRTTVVVKAGEIYEAGKFKRFLLGDHYRDTWTAPVEVPIINMDKAKGGLEIIEKGGGMQTYSLKLKAADGKLYSLRSIQKDPSPTLPKPLQYSFADDIVQDQISASHPYAAFLLPDLGDAAGIYHTNPKLVYIPDTEKLGDYREDFGGVLAMLEEDADEDWSDYEDFGYTKNAVSSESVMEDLDDDNDNKVDQMNLLRARLFDMWIGDWDRHDGQFRWAELEGDNGLVFRPIPEDRDNMLFKFDGFFPWIVRRKWAMRKFQSFKPDIRDIAGLNHNARYLDRRFLTEPSKEDWVEVARDLQKRLTDEIIEKTIKQLPDTVYAIDGEFLTSTLKQRRDKLESFATRYYAVLARTVDIVGSSKNEVVEVIHENDKTTVTMHKGSDDGEKEYKLYERVFYTDETEEIRIYGQDDADYFTVKGDAKNAPKVRLIGGTGEDTFKDESNIRGVSKKTFIYDNPEDSDIEVSKETKLKLSESLDVNYYDYKAFKYDYFGPTLFAGFNSDDGVYIGGGVIIKKHGFRKDPHAAYHKIVANVAPASFAWNFEYEGDFTKVIGDMGLNIDATVKAPNYFTNFYGFGNETVVDNDNDDFYKVRYDQIKVFPGIVIPIDDNGRIKIGPEYQYVDVKREDDRFINSSTELENDIFAQAHYLGAHVESDIKTVEDTNYPERGVRWYTELSSLTQTNQSNNKLSKLLSEFSAYYTIEEPLKTTFAARVGGATNTGDFFFYQANTVGGNQGLGRQGNVRGYERDRFAGRSSLYQNAEIRIRLARIPFYYLPLAVGVSAHFDQGRVWHDDEDSSEWHRGVGGGLWFHPLGKWVFTTTYTHSDEGNKINLNLGFLF